MSSNDALRTALQAGQQKLRCGHNGFALLGQGPFASTLFACESCERFLHKATVDRTLAEDPRQETWPLLDRLTEDEEGVWRYLTPDPTTLSPTSEKVVEMEVKGQKLFAKQVSESEWDKLRNKLYALAHQARMLWYRELEHWRQLKLDGWTKADIEFWEDNFSRAENMLTYKTDPVWWLGTLDTRELSTFEKPIQHRLPWSEITPNFDGEVLDLMFGLDAGGFFDIRGPQEELLFSVPFNGWPRYRPVHMWIIELRCGAVLAKNQELLEERGTWDSTHRKLAMFIEANYGFNGLAAHWVECRNVPGFANQITAIGINWPRSLRVDVSTVDKEVSSYDPMSPNLPPRIYEVLFGDLRSKVEAFNPAMTTGVKGNSFSDIWPTWAALKDNPALPFWKLDSPKVKDDFIAITARMQKILRSQ